MESAEPMMTGRDVVDVNDDARAVRESLDALADLEEGWMDGESGLPISPEAIKGGHTLIQAMITLGSDITRIVYPTEGGGVLFYWPESENQLTIEVEPNGALYIHTTDELGVNDA